MALFLEMNILPLSIQNGAHFGTVSHGPIKGILHRTSF